MKKNSILFFIFCEIMAQGFGVDHELDGSETTHNDAQSVMESIRMDDQGESESTILQEDESIEQLVELQTTILSFLMKPLHPTRQSSIPTQSYEECRLESEQLKQQAKNFLEQFPGLIQKWKSLGNAVLMTHDATKLFLPILQYVQILAHTITYFDFRLGEEILQQWQNLMCELEIIKSPIIKFNIFQSFPFSKLNIFIGVFFKETLGFTGTEAAKGFTEWWDHLFNQLGYFMPGGSSSCELETNLVDCLLHSPYNLLVWAVNCGDLNLFKYLWENKDALGLSADPTIMDAVFTKLQRSDNIDFVHYVLEIIIRDMPMDEVPLNWLFLGNLATVDQLDLERLIDLCDEVGNENAKEIFLTFQRPGLRELHELDDVTFEPPMHNSNATEGRIQAHHLGNADLLFSVNFNSDTI
jgi:hypothetical protein